MSAKYTAGERRTAVRCADCPSCGAKAGEKCHYIGATFTEFKVPAHKRRVDKYYIDMGEFMSKPHDLATAERQEP